MMIENSALNAIAEAVKDNAPVCPYIILIHADTSSNSPLHCLTNLSAKDAEHVLYHAAASFPPENLRN